MTTMNMKSITIGKINGVLQGLNFAHPHTKCPVIGYKPIKEVDWYQSEGGRLTINLVKTRVPSIGKYVIAISVSLPYMCYYLIYRVCGHFGTRPNRD